MSYTNHTEFMYEKPVTLNVICHTAGGAAVFDVPGRTQTQSFLGYPQSHLSHSVPKDAMESAATGDSLYFTATRSVTGTFLAPF